MNMLVESMAAGRQAGRPGAGAIPKSLHFDSKIEGKEKTILGLLQAFETSKSSPSYTHPPIRPRLLQQGHAS